MPVGTPFRARPEEMEARARLPLDEEDPDEIEPPPAFGARIRADFIVGMGKVDGHFVILLDIERVLSVDDNEENLAFLRGLLTAAGFEVVEARDGAVFAVLDPPANQSATDIVTYVATTAALEQLSEFGAIYWPRVKVLNPQKSVFGSAEA